MKWEDIIYKIAKKVSPDSPTLVLVSSSNLLVFKEGIYGGYVYKTDDLKKLFGKDKITEDDVKAFISSFIPFFVEVRANKTKDEEIINRAKALLDTMPEEVRRELSDGDVYMAEYTFVEVNVSLSNFKENYIAVNVSPKENPKRGTARAVEIREEYRSAFGKSVYKRFKLKYPEIQDKLDFRDHGKYSSVILREVIETPKVPLPVPAVVPSTPSSKNTPVLINGFLVISRLPSKALLDASLPEVFKNTKIGKKEIKLVIGYFYNKLGTLARKFYNGILAEYAISVGFGYIVPKENVDRFLEEVNILKDEYREYEQKLKDFLLNGVIPEDISSKAKIDQEYTEIVMEFLRVHGVDKEVKRRIERLNIAERVDIKLLPFSVDLSILEEYIDEKVRQKLEKEIYETRKEILENAKKHLTEKIKKLAMKIEKLAKSRVTEKKLEMLKKEIEAVEKTARDFGLEIKEIEVIKEILEAPIEEIGSKALSESVSGRLRALLDSF